MKQLIIIVCYLNSGNANVAYVRERMSELNAILQRNFPQELQNETNTILKWVIIPVSVNQDTKIECIYPKEFDEDATLKLNTIEEKFKEFINDTKRS